MIDPRTPFQRFVLEHTMWFFAISIAFGFTVGELAIRIFTGHW